MTARRSGRPARVPSADDADAGPGRRGRRLRIARRRGGAAVRLEPPRDGLQPRLRGGQVAARCRDVRVTVARENGEQLTYDPRRLQGVAVYRESERAFAVGDRVQVTAPDQARHIANRELGTVERMDPSDANALYVRLDSGRAVAFERDRSLHLDYGYAVTSHSSQGQTADRVLAHIDTGRAGEALVNRRFAYVALSRSRYYTQVYTNDKTELTQALGREQSHRSALEPSVGQKSEALELAKSTKITQTIGHGFSH
jgi:hypothetical protein